MAKPIPKEVFDGPNRLMVLVPLRDEPCNGMNYRWSVHFALPFPMPTKKCFSNRLQIGEWKFIVGIHNHFDRIHVLADDPKCAESFFLIDKQAKTPALASGYRSIRHTLTSVAVFDDVFNYTDGTGAYANSQSKIEACIDFLTEYLSKCQLAAPFSCGWLVYPPALQEYGVIYFGVRRIVEGNADSITATEACRATATERSIQHPLFTMPLPKVDADVHAMLQLPYELLAEANVASLRGSYRLTVINSYNAVELLANNVFSEVNSNYLKNVGVPQPMAESLVEERRAHHRTDIKFLTHDGIKPILNRSLLEEEKSLYDRLIIARNLRHQVAHAGFKPTAKDGKACFKTCCEVVRWLANVAGLSVKTYYPSAEEIADKFIFSFVNSEQFRQVATVPVWDIKYFVDDQVGKVRWRVP